MTTIDLDACAGRRREAADLALQSALRLHPIPPALLATWRAMQQSTCDDLVGVLLEGGSIRNMVETSCEARLAQEFAQTLGERRYPPAHSSLYHVLRAEEAFAISYRRQLANDRERALFDRAQADWIRFESLADTSFGRRTSSRLANERIADLQASWIGERFW